MKKFSIEAEIKFDGLYVKLRGIIKMFECRTNCYYIVMEDNTTHYLPMMHTLIELKEITTE